MVKLKVYSSKGEWVGDINTDEKTYYTQRDFKQNQVFKYIYGNPVAVDVCVLKQLVKEGVQFIAVLITNFRESSFYCVSTMIFFLENSQSIDYKEHGLQRRMTMELWKKANSLDEVKEIRERLNTKLSEFVGG